MTVAVEASVGGSRRPLPPNWRWARLGEVARYINGRAFKPEEWRTSGLPIIRIQNLNSVDAPFNYFDAEVHPGHRVDDGDLLISWSASLDAFLWTRGPAVLNQHIFKVEERPELVCRIYLYFAVREVMSEIRAQVHGATMRHITKPEFEAIQIPLPPLEDQQHIGEILTQEMAVVERARAAAENQIKAASALAGAYLRKVFDSADARAWPTKCLGEIVLLVQNGLYKPADMYGVGHPFLRMYNIRQFSWQLDLSRLAYITLEGDEAETFGLRSDDLLVSRVNSFELVGKCARVTSDAEGSVFENMLIRLRLRENVDSLFVAQQMNTPAVRSQIESVAKRAIGQASINSTDIRGLEVRLPSLSLQRRLSAYLDMQVKGAHRVRCALEEALLSLDRLPSTLLRRAFKRNL